MADIGTRNQTDTAPQSCPEFSLPVVRPDFHAANYGRIEPEVLLHATQATVLDRGASLDDEGDRRGPTIGRLPKGVSHERARCLRGVLLVRDIAIPEAHRVKSEWPPGSGEVLPNRY